jgi:hypothetical protein
VDQAALARLLDEALQRLGVVVRMESLPEESRLRGGFCLVRGKREVFVSPRASLAERIAILSEALSQIDTNSIWLAPVIRERLLDRWRAPVK